LNKEPNKVNHQINHINQEEEIDNVINKKKDIAHDQAIFFKVIFRPITIYQSHNHTAKEENENIRDHRLNFEPKMGKDSAKYGEQKSNEAESGMH